MGVQKPIFDYTKIEAFYIEEFACKQASQYTNNKKRVLDTLSKALHFVSYKHFKSAFEISQSTKYLDPNKDYYDPYIKYNVGDRGYYFSEFILEKELGLPLAEAYSLKLAIDHHSDYFDRRYDGNISWADPCMVAQGLEYIKRGERVRIMADYPLKFYFRLDTSAITVSTESSAKLRFKALFSDGFHISNLDYFTNIEHAKQRVLDVLDIILSSFNILFYYNVLEVWQEYHPWLYQLIKENYNAQEVHLSKDWLYRDALFLPKKQRALSLRFGAGRNRTIKRNRPLKSLNKRPASQPSITKHQCEVGFFDSIGSKLRKLRKSTGYTQSTLAEALGVSIRTIAFWEKNTYKPGAENRMKIIKLLNVDYHQLF